MVDAPALSCQNLWFSYEVAENISTTAKFVGDDVTKAAAKKGTQAHGTHDGGLSMDMPRQQHLSGTRAAYKLQLEAPWPPSPPLSSARGRSRSCRSARIHSRRETSVSAGRGPAKA